MARKRINLSLIGGLTNDRFYQIKKLCVKADKIEAIINALQDYDDFVCSSMFQGPNSEKIQAFEEEYMEVYHDIQKLLKNKKP